MPTVIWIILIALTIGLMPFFPYSKGWGYYPSGFLVLIFLIIILHAVFYGGGI